jgi:hypothetical protein
VAQAELRELERGGVPVAERILTAVQTLRLQQRSVPAYLTSALAAHRDGLPAPQLLPNG